MDRALDEALVLELAQAPREQPVREARDGLRQLGEVVRALGERPEIAPAQRLPISSTASWKSGQTRAGRPFGRAGARSLANALVAPSMSLAKGRRRRGRTLLRARAAVGYAEQGPVSVGRRSPSSARRTTSFGTPSPPRRPLSMRRREDGRQHLAAGVHGGAAGVAALHLGRGTGSSARCTGPRP